MHCVNRQIHLKHWKGAPDSWRSTTDLDIMISKVQAGYLQIEEELPWDVKWSSKSNICKIPVSMNREHKKELTDVE